jgi:hypothetical protein
MKPRRRGFDWLSQIEDLSPGDACEVKDGLTGAWLPAIVITNGMASYWRARRESDGCEVSLFIENVRLPGQIEAWPPLGSS